MDVLMQLPFGCAVLRAAEAAAKHASGQYEAAAEGFRAVLGPAQDELALEFAVQPNDRDCRAWACLAAKSYASVQDWDQLQAWLHDCQVLPEALYFCFRCSRYLYLEARMPRLKRCVSKAGLLSLAWNLLFKHSSRSAFLGQIQLGWCECRVMSQDIVDTT